MNEGRPGNPNEFRIVIPAEDPNARPPARVPSSRTIARLREKAEAAARAASAAQALSAQVQRAFQPPAGKIFGVDTVGLLLVGPAGAIGTTTRMAKTLEPLAVGGRHPATALMTAGGWASEDTLREALTGLGPKLAVIGLRLCRRKTGLRMAKAR